MPQAMVSIGGLESDYTSPGVPNLAPGEAGGFNAWCAIRGVSEQQVDPLVMYFYNSNGTTTGWYIGRAADIAADPVTGQPNMVVLQFGVAQVAPALMITAEVHIPRSMFIGRTLLIGGFMAEGAVGITLNGVQDGVTSAIVANVPGASGLHYGSSSVDCEDKIIGAGYSGAIANPPATHQAVFERFVQVEGGSVMQNALTAANVPIPQYIYDSWDLRGPSLTVPLTLPNDGVTAGGDLTASDPLDMFSIVVDKNPNITGATQILLVIP